MSEEEASDNDAPKDLESLSVAVENDKASRNKGTMRGRGKKRTRGAANVRVKRTPNPNSECIDEECVEDSPTSPEQNSAKRQALKDQDDETENLNNKIANTRKSLRTSQNDMEESGQPPGEGSRSSRRRSAISATLEEPPDSPILDDEDDEIDEKSSNNEKSGEKNEQDCPKQKEPSPTSQGDRDNLLSPTRDSLQDETSLQEPPFGEKDNGSEAGSESEEKAPDERESSKKRGRGRPPMAFKRGRRRKSPVSIQLSPDLPDYLREELQHAFKIFLALRSIPKIGPFLYKPSAYKFGMATYYTIIKSPMWLDEVKRKLMSHGYSCISQFVSDIRLMLENCYKYWGQEHHFSKTALQIESKLQQKIDCLPEPLKAKCKNDTENVDFIKMEPDDFRGFSEESTETAKIKVKNFSSDLLLKASKKENELPPFDKSREDEVLAWERLHLFASNEKSEINSRWEIGAIGLFFLSTHEFLSLSKIRQYEIERMLLIPRESTTLANIMTTLLSPAAVRSKLDATVPIMSFEVWNKKLRKKVEDWFNIYYNKNGSESEVFLTCGIEPCFWKTMTYVNHFEDKDFSEISFHQRCSILKALCDNLCFTTKCIQDLISTEDSNSVASNEATLLGYLEDFVYFFLPFWPDIRVYKMRISSDRQIASSKSFSILTNKLLKYISPLIPPDETNGNKVLDVFEEFSLVADSPAELLVLMNKVKCLNVDLSSKLTKFYEKSKELSSSSLHTLSHIYDQWTGYSERKDDFASESLSYWDFNDDVSSDKGYFDVGDPEVLGKRVRKTKLSASHLTSSEEEEDIFDREDDGSDWECPSEKKKMMRKDKGLKDLDMDSFADGKSRKKRLSKPPKTKIDQANKKCKTSKKASTPTKDGLNLGSPVIIESVTSLSNETKLTSSEGVNNSFPLHEEIVIKSEPNLSVKLEPEDSDNVADNVNKQPLEAVKCEMVKEVKKEIKQETISDVILLSSQEEDDDDDDVIITTPLKQMPQPVQVTTPTPVRPPPPTNINPSPNMRNPTPPVTPVRVMSPILRSPQTPGPRTPNPTNSPMNIPRLNFTGSPRLVSPRQNSPRMPTTPRQRFSSPMHPSFTPPNLMMSSPRQRTVSPRGYSPSQPRPSPPRPTPPRPAPPQVSRNLFNNIRPNQPPANPNSKSITAKLTFGKRDDGSYGYLARLPDGGVINMSPQQIDSIRKKNNNSIPSVINIPIG